VVASGLNEQTPGDEDDLENQIGGQPDDIEEIMKQFADVEKRMQAGN